jgi:hypothetical protein
VLLTRRLAGFLVVAGAFQWLVWPNFLRVVWKDDRAFGADGGPTAFLVVHVCIVVPALLLGTGLLWLGVVAWRRAGRPDRAPATAPERVRVR